MGVDEISDLIAFAKEAGGIEYAYATMNRLRDEAVDILNDAHAGAEGKALISLLDFIITRDN